MLKGYKEVFNNSVDEASFRSVIVRTSGSHGILHDVKLPEYAGGISYSTGGQRRQLLWRVQRDTVELIEHSLHVNLTQNHLRVQLVGSALLPGLCVLRKSANCLVLLMASTVSVHYCPLLLSPPLTATSRLAGSRDQVSVLSQVTAALLTRPGNVHLLPPSGTSVPYTASCGLLGDGTGVFLLAAGGGVGGGVGGGAAAASSPGVLVLVNGERSLSQPLQTDSSLMGRLMGLVGAVGMGVAGAVGMGVSAARPEVSRIDAAQLVTVSSVVLAVAVCTDSHLRVWSGGAGGGMSVMAGPSPPPPAAAAVAAVGRQLFDLDMLRSAGIAAATHTSAFSAAAAASTTSLSTTTTTRAGKSSAYHVSMTSQQHQLQLRLLDQGGDSGGRVMVAVYLATTVASGGGGGATGGAAMFVLGELSWQHATGCQWRHRHTLTTSSSGGGGAAGGGDDDLIDFRLGRDAVWALWTTDEGLYRVTVCHLASLDITDIGCCNVASHCWRTVDKCDAIPPPIVSVQPDQHPAHAHIDAIFYPDRFSLQTIRRALAVFSGGDTTINNSSSSFSATTTTTTDAAAGGKSNQNAIAGNYGDISSSGGVCGDERAQLVAAMCGAVEAKCRQVASGAALADTAERLHVTSRCWHLLYSACLQYHMVRCKPLGLAVSVVDTVASSGGDGGAVTAAEHYREEYYDDEEKEKKEEWEKLQHDDDDDEVHVICQSGVCRVRRVDPVELLWQLADSPAAATTAAAAGGCRLQTVAGEFAEEVLCVVSCCRQLQQLTPAATNYIVTSCDSPTTTGSSCQPSQLAAATAQQLLRHGSTAGGVMEVLRQLVTRCGVRVTSALTSLLQLLEIEAVSEDECSAVLSASAAASVTAAAGYSDMFHQLLAGTVQQQLQLHCQLLQLLLLLLQLLVFRRQLVSPEQLRQLVEQQLPWAEQLWRACDSVVWLAGVAVRQPATSTLTALRQQQQSLAGAAGVVAGDEGPPLAVPDGGGSLLLALIGGRVGRVALHSLTTFAQPGGLPGGSSSSSSSCWSQSLALAGLSVVRWLWPPTRDTDQTALLAETLWRGGQHWALARLETRLRGAGGWCVRGGATRQLLVAFSLLAMGRHEAATQLLAACGDSVAAATATATAASHQHQLLDPAMIRLLHLAVSSSSSNSGTGGGGGGGHRDTVTKSAAAAAAPPSLVISFYLRVVRVLEAQRLWVAVVVLAARACQLAPSPPPPAPGGATTAAAAAVVAATTTVWSVLFKYQLLLGRITAAYTSLLAPPLAATRVHCIRQLLMTLLQRRQLSCLLQLPLAAAAGGGGQVRDQVCQVLWQLARARHSHCYWLLYGLYVQASDYRSAGRVMYELSTRVTAAGDSTAAAAAGDVEMGDNTAAAADTAGAHLLWRHQCLSAAANALSLVHPDNAWLVTAAAAAAAAETNRAPKEMRAGGEEMDGVDEQGEVSPAGVRVRVVSLDQLRVETLCVWSRHVLAARHSVITTDTVTAQQLVKLLSVRGHWLLAQRLARQTSCSAEPIVQEMCSTLVSDQLSEEQQWQLVADNRLPESVDGGSCSARQQLWQLLRHVLDTAPAATAAAAVTTTAHTPSHFSQHQQQQQQQQRQLTRAAVQRILQLGHALPDWLAAKLERLDASALCRLLLRAGRLEAASWLLVRLLETNGRQLLQQLQQQQQQELQQLRPVCFPYGQLDHAMDELESAAAAAGGGGSCSGTSRLALLHSCLSDKLAHYLTIVQSASQYQLTGQLN